MGQFILPKKSFYVPLMVHLRPTGTVVSFFIWELGPEFKCPLLLVNFLSLSMLLNFFVPQFPCL